MYLTPDVLPLKSGDVIAYTGNTGVVQARTCIMKSETHNLKNHKSYGFRFK